MLVEMVPQNLKAKLLTFNFTGFQRLFFRTPLIKWQLRTFDSLKYFLSHSEYFKSLNQGVEKNRLRQEGLKIVSFSS